MPLTAGERLGPYEIVSLLGAGGMGEVYKAKDTRLERTVAIKVLPAQSADNAEARQRFEREARAVSNLNHPHICTLHDVGRHGGVDYLVMEHLEGESLAARLAGGALPLDQALRYAVEIAEALAEAHRHGICHRDLKPGNVMLTRAGAKLLDFGLAKLLPAASGAMHLSALPTEADTLTHPGAVMGTVQYMAPEQLEGKDADPRSDIFAFGAVVYEMLTGRRAFPGNSAASVIASIMTAPTPSVSAVKPVAPALDHLIQKCLAKAADERWQSAQDLASELKWLASGSQLSASVTLPGIAAVPPRRSSRVWITAAVVLAAALGVLAVVHFGEAPAARREVRFQVPPPAKSNIVMLRLSPDGRYLAFTASGGGRVQLWVRALDSLEAHPLRGTEGARYPFWSPDNAFLGFFAEGKLKKIAIAGGSPQNLCDTSDGRGGTWNRDGVIVFSPGPVGGLQRVSADGGVPTLLTKPEGGAVGHRFPEFLPDGRRFLFLATAAKAETSGLYAASLDGKPPVRISGRGSNAMLVAPVAAGQSGLLLFREENTLMAQPFDPEGLALRGEMFPVAEQVGIAGNQGHGAFTVSANGVLAYRSGRAFSIGSRGLQWLDRAGKRLGDAAVKPGLIRDVSLSPDEKRIAVSIVGAQEVDVWLVDAERAALTRFTFGPGSSAGPVWSPDGSRLAFTRIPTNTGAFEVFEKAIAGTGQQRLVEGGMNAWSNDWSRDGKWLVYSSYGSQTRGDLWLLPLEGERKPRPYLQTSFDESQGQFSPDGRWMAYVSDESGQDQVYVQPVPVSGAKWQISTAGGGQPRWRRDGRELFYLGADGQLVAVPVQSKAGVASFEAGTPQALFELRGVIPFVSVGAFGYQPASNGQRFLANLPAEGEAEAPVTVVLNWQPGMKK